MRVTLELSDLLTILGKHFGATLLPENVKVRADPFEVEVMNVPLDEAPEPEPAYAPPPPPPSPPPSRAATRKSEINLDVPDDLLDDGSSIPDDPPVQLDAVDTSVRRALGPNASHVPPPYDPSKEIV